MSIFDSIGDSISSLFDDNAGTADLADMFSGDSLDIPTSNDPSTVKTSSSSGLLSTAQTIGRGLGINQQQVNAKAAKEDSLYRFLQVDSAKQNTNMINSFKPTKTGFDNANYFASPDAIQSKWNQILMGYASGQINPQAQLKG